MTSGIEAVSSQYEETLYHEHGFHSEDRWIDRRAKDWTGEMASRKVCILAMKGWGWYYSQEE